MAVTGVNDINKAFDRLNSAGQIRVMRRTLNKSMTPLLGALRAAAPKGTKAHRAGRGGRLLPPGFLSRSIRKSTKISRDKQRVFGNVRVAGDAWYGSLIEHGWRAGRRSGAVRGASGKALSDKRLSELGDRRRKIAGKPWFNPVAKRMADDVADDFIENMGNEIVKEWLK